jgi:hypothetical protein
MLFFCCSSYQILLEGCWFAVRVPLESVGLLSGYRSKNVGLLFRYRSRDVGLLFEHRWKNVGLVFVSSEQDLKFIYYFSVLFGGEGIKGPKLYKFPFLFESVSFVPLFLRLWSGMGFGEGSGSGWECGRVFG